MSGSLHRRHVLAGIAASLWSVTPARSAAPRVAVIDWAMLETVLALGVAPVAATELILFRATAIEPAVPVSVADLGLRGTPNYELLQMVFPGLILISNFYESQRGRLERIAPVASFPIYLPGRAPYVFAEQAMTSVAGHLDRLSEAHSYIADARSEIERCRASLGGLKRPVFIISLGDARHFRAFGTDSMFGDVLARLGQHNAWDRPSSYSATAPVGLEALARVPDAVISVVAPAPSDVMQGLSRNAVWNALPAVRKGRVALLPSIDHYGGLPAAVRFARLFTEAMSQLGQRVYG